MVASQRYIPSPSARPHGLRSSSGGPVAVFVGATFLMVALLAPGCGGAYTPVPPPDDASREVSFQTEDGITLKGRLFGQGATGVVLAHMYPADQTSWWDFANTLAENGYKALAFDFRGYRDSGGDKEMELIDRDVRAAVGFLREQGATGVFLVGASMGGTASLKVASEGNVAGVVSLSAPVQFKGLSVEDNQVRVPALLIVAEGDRGATDSLEEMANKGIVGGSELTQSTVYEDISDHGTNLIKPGARNEAAVKENILGFLKANSE